MSDANLIQYLPHLLGLTTEILISIFLFSMIVMFMNTYVDANINTSGCLYKGIHALLNAKMGVGLSSIYTLIHLHVRQGLKFLRWLDPLGWCINYYNRDKVFENRFQLLSKLPEDQKEILKPYILAGRTTQYFNLQNGIVAKLVNDKILEQPVKVVHDPYQVAFNMSAWARNILNRNQHFLDITPEEDKFW